MTLSAELDEIRRASTGRVGPSAPTFEGDDGRVRVRGVPAELALAAGLDVETYSLARMVASEAGRQPAQYMLAVAQAAVNEADHQGEQLVKLLTRGGIYGSQGFVGYAATSQNPSGRHVAAARVALRRSRSIARDATHWMNGRVQDKGKQGTKKLTHNAAEIVVKRAKGGLEWVGHLVDGGRVVTDEGGVIPILDAYLLFLMRRVKGRKADPAAGLAVVEDGRRRWGTDPDGPDLLPADGSGAVPPDDDGNAKEAIGWAATAMMLLALI